MGFFKATTETPPQIELDLPIEDTNVLESVSVEKAQTSDAEKNPIALETPTVANQQDIKEVPKTVAQSLGTSDLGPLVGPEGFNGDTNQTSGMAFIFGQLERQLEKTQAA